MLLIEAKNIKKHFGERILFEIKDLKVYSEDKIGIVGLNGSGKTTLVKALMGLDQEDIGDIKRCESIGYIPQLNLEDQMTLSGGEYIKQKIDAAFNKRVHLIIADEPTSNLDMDGVRYLENKMNRFEGGLLVISHDVELLNKVCNKILEIERGMVTVYKGNYQDYLEIKEKSKNNQACEYEKYVKEKSRLETTINEREQRASEFKRAPSRMGNSESRLHRRSAGERRAKVERTKINLQARVDKLEVKEKPFEMKEVKIKVPIDLMVYSKVLVQGEHLDKKFGNKEIFKDSQFAIENNKKTVLLGPNGSGKTTLLNMICSGAPGITIAPKLKIGYFKQNLDNLKNELSVLENVLETTSRSELEIRNILANFLFKKEDVYKKVEVLSGGERIKASFAKVFLSDINFLILDEPTNYLDISTRQSLEDALIHYEGPVLIVSHDRAFVARLAETIIYIENQKLYVFGDNFEAFNERNTSKKKDQGQEVQLMVLQNRLNVVLSRISMPMKQDSIEALEKEYTALLAEIKAMQI